MRGRLTEGHGSCGTATIGNTMQTDSQLIDRLTALSASLPAAQVTFSECLARQRDRFDGEEFRLTEFQRQQARAILDALAQGQGGRELPDQVPATERVVELAQRVRQLRERKKALEEELVQATDELVREVGLGVTTGAEGLRVRIGEPRLSVKVTDPEVLPPDFLSLQPDRKSILAHVRAAAEVPPGTEVTETRPTVYFSRPR